MPAYGLKRRDEQKRGRMRETKGHWMFPQGGILKDNVPADDRLALTEE